MNENKAGEPTQIFKDPKKEQDFKDWLFDPKRSKYMGGEIYMGQDAFNNIFGVSVNKFNKQNNKKGFRAILTPSRMRIFLEAVNEAAKLRIWKPAELNRLVRIKERKRGRS